MSRARQRAKRDSCDLVLDDLPARGEETEARDDLVRAPAESVEHLLGLGGPAGLPEDAPVEERRRCRPRAPAARRPLRDRPGLAGGVLAHELERVARRADRAPRSRARRARTGSRAARGSRAAAARSRRAEAAARAGRSRALARDPDLLGRPAARPVRGHGSSGYGCGSPSAGAWISIRFSTSKPFARSSRIQSP